MGILSFLSSTAYLFRCAYDKFVRQSLYKSMLGYCGNNVTMRNLKGFPSKSVKRMYLYDNVVVKSFSLISVTGKFIMKENSGASTGLIVITGNHQRKAGQLFILEAKSHDLDIEEDVIVEEDVWLGANVTLLAGVTIGRGATVGAGAVCFKSIPPYSIAVGNPAKVVGFNFTPEEILAHEEKLYPKETRLSKDTLEKNYKKYFLDRIKEIKSFTRI